MPKLLYSALASVMASQNSRRTIPGVTLSLDRTALAEPCTGSQRMAFGMSRGGSSQRSRRSGVAWGLQAGADTVSEFKLAKGRLVVSVLHVYYN